MRFCEYEERIIYISVCVCVCVCVCGYTHTHTHTKGVRRRNESNRVFVRFLTVRIYLSGKIMSQKKICFFHVQLVGLS